MRCNCTAVLDASATGGAPASGGLAAGDAPGHGATTLAGRPGGEERELTGGLDAVAFRATDFFIVVGDKFLKIPAAIIAFEIVHWHDSHLLPRDI